MIGHMPASPLETDYSLSAEKAEQWSLVHNVGVENISTLQDDRQQMVWACVCVRACVCVSETGCAQLCGNEMEN